MAEMSKITSFKTFTQLRAEESAAKLAEERAAKRGELSAKLATILDEMDIVSFEELDEETATAFINKAFGVVSEESEESLEEGNAFIYAAAKAKTEGKKEFEFNGKTYKVSLKADTGLKESEEVSEAKIKMNNFDWGKTTAERNANLDKYDSLKTDKEKEEFLKSLKNESVLNEAKLNKKDTAEIAQKVADIFTRESADAKEFFKYIVNDDVDPMVFDLDVEKTAKTPKKYADDPNYFGELAGGSFLIKDEGDCWCVYNAALGMAHIEKFSKADLSLIEESVEVNEAVIVTGKRAAKTVMKAYEGFFNAHPALGRNALGVPAIHHIGAIKELYRLAMEDANFSREVPATVNKIKGRLFPVEVKVADLNNATLKVSIAKLQSLIEQHASAISSAAKWSGLAIVEGTAMYLDSIKQTKYAEDLLNAFNATFESVEVMEARVLEGNAFGSARLKAIAAGKDEFEFDGKTYNVKVVDAEDKEAAEDFVSEGAKEEQEAMDIYTQVAGPGGSYSEPELAKGDMDLFMEIVTAAGHKGSKAKKIADEFRKIATMESVLFEATVEMDAMDPDNKDFLKFLKKHKVSIINKEMDGPGGGQPVITMQGKKRDLEKVLGDCDYGWCDEDLAEYIEESVTVNEAEVKSDEEFKEYAFTVLQKAFGEDFDEAKAEEVVDGLISKHSGDYGAMVGALQSSLG